MSQVTVAANAARNLEKLPAERRQEIFEAIEEVQDRPENHLKRTPHGHLKLHIGEYAALFSLHDDGDNLRLWMVGKNLNGTDP